MRRNLIFAIVVLAVCPVLTADYYVATDGDDAGLGTLGDPFETIQHAADVATAGDTIYIRGGTYHEVVSLDGVIGSSGNEITFTNYNGEIVTLDGTIGITSGWTQYSGNIYKTTLSEDIWQLFVDGECQTLARFPNAEVWSDFMWQRDASRRFESDAGTNGHMIDNPSVGHVDTLAAAGVSFDDCVAIMNLRNWTTYARLVENHTAGTDNFDYDPAPAYTDTNAAYIIEGGLNGAELIMLDIAKEWAYDESTKTLYLWADDGLSPAGRDIRGKNQPYFFTGTANTDYVTIDGLNFFATTVSFSQSDYITVQNCKFDYPSCAKRALGSINPSEPTDFGGLVGDHNQHNTVYNCEFRYVDGPVIYYKNGDFMTIENNYFYMVDYACLDEGFSLNGNNANGTIYTRNTLEISGDSEGCRIEIENPNQYPATVSYNYHTRCGLMQTDGASVQYNPTSVTDSENCYNWFIYNDRYCFRFDGDPAGQYGNVYRNVAINPKKTTFRLKGDFHEIFNNTAVDIGGDFNVAIEKGGNEHTETRNIAADRITDWPVPGTSSNLYNGSVEGTDLYTLLRDPENLDFRPKATSTQLIDAGIAVVTAEDVDVTAGYIGAAPDIGAYEYGDTNYFIGGRLWPHASRPVPPSGNDCVKLDADLMWRQALNATSYDVYFGTQSGNLTFQGNQSNNIFGPGTLAADTIYYWRIDAVTPTGTVTGQEWNFDTTDTTAGLPVELNCIADTRVNINSDINYGGDDPLRIQNVMQNRAYFKFNVADIGDVESAVFRLRVGLGLNFDIDVYETDNAAWDEFTINHYNDPLTWGSLLDTEPDCSQGYWYEFDVSDAVTGDGVYTLAVTTDTPLAGLKVNSREGSFPPTLTVTPTGGTPGNYPPAFDEGTFTKPDATENIAYSDTIADDASDPDGDPLTFSKTGGPAWLTVATDGTLSGTPSSADIGVNTFGVRVTDDEGAYDEAQMTITVVAGGGNNPPAFSSDPIVKANGEEDVAYSGSIAEDASDPDEDPLTFSKTGGPAWLSVATDGTLSGTPTSSDVGLNQFTVQVDDGNGGTDTATLEITVDAAPPVTPDMYVYDIAMGYRVDGDYKYAQATVTIKDDTGAAVSGASISAAWSGLIKRATTGVTLADGTVMIESPGTKKSGDVTFTVNDVTATGYNYNSSLNIETSDTVTLP